MKKINYFTFFIKILKKLLSVDQYKKINNLE